MLGTPGYMAPEQARGRRGDRRARRRLLARLRPLQVPHRPAAVRGRRRAGGARQGPVRGAAARPSSFAPTVPRGSTSSWPRCSSKTRARPPARATRRARRPALAALAADCRTPRARPSRTLAAAITGAEQRLVSVVLASADRAVTDGRDAARRPGRRVDRRLAGGGRTSFGAEVDALADGALVVDARRRRRAATDQAAQAARCALALRRAPARARDRRSRPGDASSAGPRPSARSSIAPRRCCAIASSDPRRSTRRSAIRTAALPPRRRDRRPARRPLRGRRRRDRARRSTGEREGSTRRGADAARQGRRRASAASASSPSSRRRSTSASSEPVRARGARHRAGRRRQVAPPPRVPPPPRRARRRAARVEVWIARGDPMAPGSPFGMLGAGAPPRRGHPRRRAARASGAQKLRARVARNLPARPTRTRRRVPRRARRRRRSPTTTSVQLRAARQTRLMGDQMRRAFEDFLAAECASRPVLLVLEDLHWGDLPTVQLVDAALRNLHDAPLHGARPRAGPR